MTPVPLRLLLVCTALLAFSATPALSQTALPTGAPVQGTATDETPADYTFKAATPGVLSVAVQGSGDLVLQLLDEDGQTVPDGSADRDLNGSSGTELLSATVGEAGTYRVRVRVQSGGNSTFQIAGSFLSFPPFARPSDPDRRPGQARALQIGKAHDDALDPGNGDMWDWFSFKADAAGTLAVVTRPLPGSESDLVLELYTDGEFSRAAERSDQDMQGNGANESATVNVNAGDVVHVKVLSNGSQPGKYRLSSSLIP